MNPTRRKHGMLLYEMIFVIAILGVVMVLEAELFNASMRTVGAMPAAQAQTAQLVQMTETLRRDVWSATSIEQSDPRRILVVQADGSNIAWDFSQSDRVNRSTTQPAQSREWSIPSPPVPLTGRAGLTLQTPTDRRLLLSQVMISKEMK